MMISVIELQVRDISRSPHFTYEITTPALYQLAYTEIKRTTETGESTWHENVFVVTNKLTKLENHMVGTNNVSLY